MDGRALGVLAAERVADLLDSPGAGLVCVHGSRLTLIGSVGGAAMPPDAEVDERSAVAEAIRTGVPVIVEDYADLGGPYDGIARQMGCDAGVAVPFLGGDVWGGFSALLPPTAAAGAAVLLMERFAAIISAALANAQAQERLRFRARFEEALREVASASAALDVDERALAGLVAERAAELLRARVTAVVQFTADGPVLLGTGGEVGLPEFVPTDPDSSIGIVARTGATAVIEDFAELGGAYAEAAARIGCRSAAAVPVYVGGELWGSITAASRTSGFHPDAPELLERFAGLITAALANAQAQARLRGEARLERMMQRITAASATGRLTDRSVGQLVADAVAELLEAPVSAVVRRDGEWLTTLGRHGSMVPDRVHIGVPSVAATVVKTNSALRTDDYASIGGPVVEDITRERPLGTVIGVPVQSHGRLWGALTAASDPGGIFNADSERWLARFAQLISATLASTEAQTLLRKRAAVMASLHDGLVVLDQSGEITAVNEPLSAMTGFASSGLVGCRPPYPFSVESCGDELADTAGVNAVERVLRRRDGSLVRVLASVSTFVNSDGSPGGRAAILKDVSESVAQARLERAMRTVATASADGHIDERGLADLVANELAELLDAPLAAVIRFDDLDRLTVLGSAGDFPFPAILDHEDRESVSAIVARTGRPARVDDYGSIAGPFAALAHKHLVAGAVGVPVRLDGKLWGCIGSMTHRTGGFPPGVESQLERFAELMSIALANVRSLRRLRQEARIEQALREVASASASGQYDATALFTLVAARVAEVLDAPTGIVVRVDGPVGTIVGRHGADYLSGELRLEDSIAASRVLATGRPVRIGDYAEERPGPGAAAHVQASGCNTSIVVPVRLGDRSWGYIAVAKEDGYGFDPSAESLLERFAALVSLTIAQANALAELQRQATTDDLTGLLNHRAFEERLRTELARATRHGRPLALVMFDLDGFKLVNDLHGHEAGNRVLQTIGRSLQEHARVGDIAARIGGDEFAIIAPETSGADAMELAHRLRGLATAAVRELNFPLTLSAGITDIGDAATVRDLFHLADTALYYAKHHGRDRVVRDTHNERDLEMTARRSERRRAFSGLAALVRAVDARDASTVRHSERVAEMSVQLALRLGWSDERCARLREAALLHDVGKVGVPDVILGKSGRLTDDEYEQLHTHAELGARITSEILDDEQVTWIRHHHERPDGRGYPAGLAGSEIPDGALLLGLADAFDAMTCGRPYQEAKSRLEAMAEMRALAGAQFDGVLVSVLDQWALTPAERADQPESAGGPGAADRPGPSTDTSAALPR